MNNLKRTFEIYEKYFSSSIVPIIIEDNIEDYLYIFKQYNIDIINYNDIQKYKNDLIEKTLTIFPYLEYKDLKDEFEDEKKYIYKITDFFIRNMKNSSKSLFIYGTDIMFKGFENFTVFNNKVEDGVIGFSKYMSFMRELLSEQDNLKLYLVVTQEQYEKLKYSNWQTVDFVEKPIEIKKMNKTKKISLNKIGD